jgi:hypothetical protein
MRSRKTALEEYSPSLLTSISIAPMGFICMSVLRKSVTHCNTSGGRRCSSLCVPDWLMSMAGRPGGDACGPFPLLIVADLHTLFIYPREHAFQKRPLII